MPIKKEIIYPIFLECLTFAEDIIWKNIFEDLAYGITPYGTYISKNFLCCSYKDKEFSYKIDTSMNAQVLYTDIYNLITKNLNILSNKEKNKKRLDFTQIENDLKETQKSWSSIKKKNIKDILIEKYIIEMKNQFSLTIKQCKYLLSTIFIGFMLKILNNSDIVYENEKIVRINGIEFKLGKIIIKKNVYNINAPFSPEIIFDKKSISENWEKHINILKKIKF
jgi:hypothetical protein